MAGGGLLVVGAVTAAALAAGASGAHGGSPPAASSSTTGHPSHHHAAHHQHRRALHRSTAGVHGGITTVAPPAPTNLHASAGRGLARISWDNAKGRHVAVSTYIVQLTPVNGGAPVTTKTDSHAATIRNLANGTSYRVEVHGVNQHGSGSPASASVTPATVPGTPKLTVTSGNGAATITWSAGGNGGSPVTGYKLRVSGHGTATTQKLPAGTTSYTASGLVNGAAYNVQLSSLNAVGSGKPAHEVGRPAGPPGAVSDVKATGKETTLHVRWRHPASTGAPITSYTVTATPTGGGSPVTTSTTHGAASFTGLQAGATYQVTVTATNSLGTGPPSSPVTAAPLQRPGAPTNLHVTGGSQGLSISWSAPANDGGSPITSYRVRATVTQPHTHPHGVLRSVSAGTTSTTLSGLPSSGRYHVAVQAFTAGGGSQPTKAEGTLP
jgi:hypothetical protein